MGTININRQLRLSPDQYFPEETAKQNICLHHTVGGSAKSTFDYWQSNPDRIATAYLVERDGTIFEVFDPLYWAHHLGLKLAKNIVYNKRTIGIELASEGGLTRQGDYLYAFDGKKKLYHIKNDTSKFVELKEPFRGFKYFDRYDAVQVLSTVELVRHLCAQFSIPFTSPASFEFAPGLLDKPGIFTHVNVREDKSDLCPAWDWKVLTPS